MEKSINTKNGVLAALAAIGGFVSHALGGWDAALQVLIGFMAADYITGLMIAAFWKRSNKSVSGALDSKASFQGLCKKGIVLALVWLGVMLDNATGFNYIRAAIILFFIGNEGLSLLENIALMGVPFPGFLKRMLEVMRDNGDNGKIGGKDEP